MTLPAIDLPDFVQAVGGTTEQVFSGFINNNLFDVADFPAVMVVTGNIDNTSPVVCAYQFELSGGFIVEKGILSTDAITTCGAWTLPVTGPKMRLLYSVGGSSINGFVFGLPRPAAKRTLSDTSPARRFRLTLPSGTAANSVTNIPGDVFSTGSLYPDMSSYNGQVQYVFNLPVANGMTTGNIRFEAFDLSGVRQQIQLMGVSVPGITTLMGGHPFGFIKWFYQNGQAPTANTIMTFDVIPASPGAT